MGQEKAICDLLCDLMLADAKPTRKPMGDDCYEVEVGYIEIIDTVSDRVVLNVREFRSQVISLLWVAPCTRPYIAFAAQKTTLYPARAQTSHSRSKMQRGRCPHRGC